jgi:hypothetical protein
MFRKLMAVVTSQMMTSHSLICLLENQNGGKLQKSPYSYKRVSYAIFEVKLFMGAF